MQCTENFKRNRKSESRKVVWKIRSMKITKLYLAGIPENHSLAMLSWNVALTKLHESMSVKNVLYFKRHKPWVVNDVVCVRNRVCWQLTESGAQPITQSVKLRYTDLVLLTAKNICFRYKYRSVFSPAIEDHHKTNNTQSVLKLRLAVLSRRRNRNVCSIATLYMCTVIYKIEQLTNKPNKRLFLSIIFTNQRAHNRKYHKWIAKRVTNKAIVIIALPTKNHTTADTMREAEAQWWFD